MRLYHRASLIITLTLSVSCRPPKDFRETPSNAPSPRSGAGGSKPTEEGEGIPGYLISPDVVSVFVGTETISLHAPAKAIIDEKGVAAVRPLQIKTAVLAASGEPIFAPVSAFASQPDGSFTHQFPYSSTRHYVLTVANGVAPRSPLGITIAYISQPQRHLLPFDPSPLRPSETPPNPNSNTIPNDPGTSDPIPIPNLPTSTNIPQQSAASTGFGPFAAKSATLSRVFLRFDVTVPAPSRLYPEMSKCAPYPSLTYDIADGGVMNIPFTSLCATPKRGDEIRACNAETLACTNFVTIN